MRICIQLGYPQVIVLLSSIVPKNFNILKHGLFIFCLYLSHSHCEESNYSQLPTCAILSKKCILNFFDLTWLLFTSPNAAQASLPPESLLGSFRLGFSSSHKALCVSIMVLIILYCLCTCIFPLWWTESLLRSGLFVLLSFQDSSGHKTWVISEYLWNGWVKDWVLGKIWKWVLPLGKASWQTLGMSIADEYV